MVKNYALVPELKDMAATSSRKRSAVLLSQYLAESLNISNSEERLLESERERILWMIMCKFIH
jgi:hypothetical protein